MLLSCILWTNQKRYIQNLGIELIFCFKLQNKLSSFQALTSFCGNHFVFRNIQNFHFTVEQRNDDDEEDASNLLHGWYPFKFISKLFSVKVKTITPCRLHFLRLTPCCLCNLPCLNRCLLMFVQNQSNEVVFCFDSDNCSSFIQYWV